MFLFVCLFEEPYNRHNKIEVKIIDSEDTLHGLEPLFSGGANTLPSRPRLPVPNMVNTIVSTS